MEPVSVGLVGAGPWATMVHAPMLAAGPDTRLAGVWARRPEAAAELASGYGVPACGTLDELLSRSAAVAFAVPPDVQAELGVRAARAGKALLLEKPLALDLPAARALAAAVAEAGVVTQVVLSNRYHPAVRDFLARAAGFQAYGARACLVSGAFLGGPFATPWRLAHGALLDLGPHALDLLVAALGPVESIRAAGDPRRWISLTAVHAGGAISETALSGAVPVDPGVSTVELYGPGGLLAIGSPGLDWDGVWPVVAAEFAAAVRADRPGELDVRRGLMLQELLAAASAGPAPAGPSPAGPRPQLR
jgi:predicted dehydrogenase